MRRNSAPGPKAPAAKADGKITSAREAVSLIRSGDTVATGGFVGIGFAGGDRRRAGGALPRQRDGRRHRRAARPHASSTRPARATARSAASTTWRTRAWCKRVDRRPLGPGAEAAGAGGRRRDRGLQPAAGRHHPPLPRHRRRQARPPDQGRPRHLRRSAPRRRQAQRAHHRGPRQPDGDRRRGVPVLPRLPDQRRASCAAPPPIPTATSPWSARR